MAEAGWYPVEQDPNTERYWDGSQWSDSYRPKAAPPAPPAAPAPAAPQFTAKQVKALEKADRPFFKKKRFIIPAVFLTLIVVAVAANGGGDEGITVAGTSDGATDDSDAEVVDASTELALGTMHSRDKGFGGAAWDISIDSVTTEGECVVATGTATLREYTGDGVASSGFSFPTIDVIAGGVALETLCSPSHSNQPDAHIWTLDVAVTEGTTVTWFETYENPAGLELDFAAIENTKYSLTDS